MLRTLQHPSRWIPIAVAALIVALVVVVPRGGDGEPRPDDAAELTSKQTAPLLPAPTSFKIASFNLLGGGHTDGANPKRKGWANSTQRLKWSRQILDRQGIDVVGFQEMHAGQVVRWQADNPDFQSWPLHQYNAAVGHNTISWRSSTFRLVRAETIRVPYFDGKEQRMPYVLLEHVTTGQRMWLYNAHNPANIGGNHQKWRDIGFQRAADLVKRLRAEDPTIPVFVTGDKNDREKFFCPTVGQTDLVASNGGHAQGSTCTPPRPMNVDWVLGTAPAVLTEHIALRNALVKKTTDHPVVIARATMPSAPVQRSAADRVVVVTVEGLRASTSSRLMKRGEMRTLEAIRASGPHTFNARAAVESATPLANLTSIVTGLPVARGRSGHGVKKNTIKGTVHQSAKRYVPSVFDHVHDYGLRTQIYSSSSVTSHLRRSWNAKNGARDTVGKDNGRKKITRHAVKKNDRQTVNAFRSGASRPASYTHIHLTNPRIAGEKFGFGSKKYAAAMRRLDANLRIVRNTINSSAGYKGRTLLVITSTAGGAKRSGTGRKAPQTYKVPLFVNGPGVPAGQSLYTMNPSWQWPAGARVSYARRPIHTAVIANLALTTLQLPSLSGATLNSDQRFNVLLTP